VDGDRHDRERLMVAGFSVLTAPRTKERCLGDHGTDYTPEQAFSRWRWLWHRHRRTGAQAWIEPWLDQLSQRYKRSGLRRDLFAMLGAYIGATEDLDDVDHYDIRLADPVLERLIDRFAR
jgi:hypothetical protein